MKTASFRRPHPSPPPRPSAAAPPTTSCTSARSPTRRRSGASWPARTALVQALRPVLDWKPPFAKWFVGGKTQRLRTTASTAISTRPRANKAAIIWEGEPGDTPRAHLPAAAPRGLQVRQRARRRSASRRATASRSTCRWCPSWPSPCWPAPASARRTRWSSAASPPRRIADRNNDAQAKLRHHRRRRLAARQASCRSRRTSTTRSPNRPTVENVHRPQARRQATSHMQAGRDFWWHELMADASRRLPRRAARQRAPALHPLHQRLDRQTQGHHAHHGRLHALYVKMTYRSGCSISATRTSTGAPPTSAGSPATATSSTARWPTARRCVMYEGAPELPATKTASGRSSRSTASTIFYTAPDGHPRVHQVGRRVAEQARPVEPAPAGHGRRADQSRSLDVVSPKYRRRALPDRRYLVADRDRRRS